MAGKIVGMTLPTDLAHGAILTETEHDYTTDGLGIVDAAYGQKQVIYTTTTRTAVYNSTTKTEVASYTVPAGMLGTGNIIRWRAHGIYKNLISTTRTIRIYIKYGSTEIYHSFETDVTTRGWDMDGKLFANGASAQDVSSFVLVNNGGSSSPWYSEILDQTFAEDSSTALDLVFNMEAPSSSGATYGWEFWYLQLELIDVS